MNTQEFTFDAVLAYNKKKHTKKEIKRTLQFLKDYTIEINDIDLSVIKYGGTILN